MNNNALPPPPLPDDDDNNETPSSSGGVVSLRDLGESKASSIRNLVSQLQQRGFACVRLDDDALRHKRRLRDGLREASALESFRFPPHNIIIDGSSTKIAYSAPKRLAFQSLFSIATCCLGAILSAPTTAKKTTATTTTDHCRNNNNNNNNNQKRKPYDSAPPPSAFSTSSSSSSTRQQQQHRKILLESLRAVYGNSSGSGHQPTTRLFGTDGNGNEPFREGQPFSQSFFNLFNYNNGLLNAHIDRSLVTVIYSRCSPLQQLLPPQQQQQHSNDNDDRNNNNHHCYPAATTTGSTTTTASVDDSTASSSSSTVTKLWIEGPDGIWRDADRAASTINNNYDNDNDNDDDNKAIVMIGEDLERYGIASSLGLYAARHAVRVNPTGSYISRSHYRPDPMTPPRDNRLSAALILRHDPEE